MQNRAERTRDLIASYSQAIRATANSLLDIADKLESAVKASDIDNDVALFVQSHNIPMVKMFELDLDLPREKESFMRSSKSVGNFQAFNTPKAQFGVSLAAMVERDGTPVPSVIKFLVEQLISLGGPHTEGVFRLTGDKEAIYNFRYVADSTGALTPLKEAIDVAVLIKNWLRALPEPPVPADMYEKAVNSQGTAVNVFEEIPEPNKTLIGFIIKFLQFMNDEQFVKYTMMNSSNLASMLAPCLMNCPHEDLSVRLINSEKEKNFVMELISNLDTSRFPEFDKTELRPVPPLSPSSCQAPSTFTPTSPSNSESFDLPPPDVPPPDIPAPDGVAPPPAVPALGPPPVQLPKQPPPSGGVAPPPAAGAQKPATVPPPRPFVPRTIPTLPRASILGNSGPGSGITPMRGILVPMSSFKMMHPQQQQQQESSTPTSSSQDKQESPSTAIAPPENPEKSDEQQKQQQPDPSPSS